MFDPDGREPFIAIALAQLAACSAPSPPPTPLEPIVPEPDPRTFAVDAVKSVTDVIAEHNRLILLTGTSKYMGEKYSPTQLTGGERRQVQVLCGCLYFPEISVKAYFESMEAGYTKYAEDIMQSSRSKPSLAATSEAARYTELAKEAKADYEAVMSAYQKAGKAGTAMLRSLHNEAGWTTVYLHTGAEDASVGQYPKVAKTRLYPWTTKPPGSHPEVQAPVDYLINNLNDPDSQDAISTANLEALRKVPFAVGVVDSGMHTFMLSYGRVYEVHWGRSPKDPNLFEVSDLDDFMAGWTSAAVAIPTDVLRKEPINFNPTP
jgi:hypothetical protein